ncbi:thioesterase family protein [Aquimarina sp. 2201CG5-10]|uniref:acyl-CoA thioesterase n=1 Tax=Aquimarina callyspongiae TaxID=3098150 RepID=UPI002AB32EE1|nr:thioesterase family protein [Aquimarina sp. 2201CG5-10]MDY8137115.1 thioesterase family protein [Aquimarina sp. 2201CG5-10]
MYIKEFEIRWNDIDANRHLANKAYIEFAAHTRMSFLSERGFDRRLLGKFNIGPVVFYEHIYYFKEVFYGRPIKVSLEISGLSEDGMFFEFRHNYYDHKGRNFAQCEMMGAWMDLQTRKLIPLPEEIRKFLSDVEFPEDFKTLTKEDTRKFNKKPKDLG